jgi:hypothetical protein
MEIQNGTLSKIYMLEEIYRKDYQSAVADRILDKLIELERETAQRDLAEYKTLLQSFETQHRMSSDDFFHRFHKGELGDDADFFEWSAVCDMYRSVCERIAKLSAASS